MISKSLLCVDHFNIKTPALEVLRFRTLTVKFFDFIKILTQIRNEFFKILNKRKINLSYAEIGKSTTMVYKKANIILV
jgi:phosphoribosylaminoimidazole-succinocarboxamide synthase